MQLKNMPDYLSGIFFDSNVNGTIEQSSCQDIGGASNFRR
jgi:hypothetical protein